MILCREGAFATYVLFQIVHTNGDVAEPRGTAKRSQKAGKKANGKNGKEGTKKSHDSKGWTRLLNYINYCIDRFLGGGGWEPNTAQGI